MTIAQHIQDLKDKKYSATELTQSYLDRIAAHDSKLNSYITVTAELALAQAKAADEIIQRESDYHPLTGIPIAQKDIFCTKGVKTSCGSKMLDNFVSPYNAHVIESFNTAGAIMLGKTNMDEFAMGSTNESSFYGAAHNPWDLSTNPGGSSGGSAAAVAANLAPGATGTDTGGSIRQPAALCGLTGIKPTYGRVSRYGMVAFASSLDQGGPMAKTAEDCAILLNTMAGFDRRDTTSINKPAEDYTATLNQDLTGKKIGIPACYFNDDLDPQVRATLETAMEVYKNQGVTFVDIDLPHQHLALGAYYIIAPAEASSNLARYDGVRYGHRAAEFTDLADMYQRSRAEGFGAEVKRRILIGTYVLSSGYYDAYYTKAQKVRALIFQDYQRAFEQVDFILSPATATTAPKIGALKDPVSTYLTDQYTLSLNLAGLPGISLCAGFINQMPIGMQLIGPALSEAGLLNCAHRYQQETQWHQQQPAGF